MTNFGRLSIASIKDQVSAGEWQARIDIAGCYRLLAHYGMSDMMANHVTLRVPGEPDAFLTNPYVMMYEEMTASSMLKINHDGVVLYKPDFGVLNYAFNKPGYILHSAVHKARPEIDCVIHTHTPAGMAVAALQCGLLPLTQTAMRFHHIAYHDYFGVVLDLAEQASLVADLGSAEAMILRNHGLLTAGKTIGEAFNWMHRLELACRSQLAAMACNTAFSPVPEDIIEATYQNYQPSVRRPYGLMEWPALLRMLDRMEPSFRE